MSGMGNAWPDDGMDGIDWGVLGSNREPSQPLSGIIPVTFTAPQTPSIIPVPQDTSAALMPPAAYAPEPPLEDPAPGDWPVPTLDQVATGPFFRMSDQGIAAIRNGAENQVRVQAIAGEALSEFARKYAETLAANPELGATPETAALLAIPGMIDIYNNRAALFEGQRLQNASDQAVLKALNDTLNRQAQSEASLRGHGLYLP